MIELGQTPAPTAEGLISDVTEASFMADVVEASQTIPVIVDFWAPWCGPCKTLGPQLENAVIAAKGAVKMAKVNVDENQGIAGQLRVQSIPTVYAFWQGQPIDGFQGAVPESELKAFVDRVVAAGGGAAVFKFTLPASKLQKENKMSTKAVNEVLRTGVSRLSSLDEDQRKAQFQKKCVKHAGAFLGGPIVA